MRTYSGSATNLLGTVGVTILAADNTVIVARSTASVTQPVTGSYEYQCPEHARNATEMIGYRWDEGTPASTATDWNPPMAFGDSTGTKTLSYRVLLDSNGDGVADVPNVGIASATCILTSDSSGAVQIGSAKVSDAQGYVTFRGLVAGTYYVWRDHPRYRFANPIVIVVT